MIILVVVKCSTGDDALDIEDDPSMPDPNKEYPDPSRPSDPFKEQRENFQEQIRADSFG